MLQAAVHLLQEIRQVKATAGLLKVYTGKDIDYAAYTTLLLSTASDYDSKHTVGKGKDRYMHMNLWTMTKMCMMHHMKWTRLT
jgi:hypothetical protein